jgi:tRNA threonylcarbamoyladenosine biosynthesis protein TsaE
MRYIYTIKKDIEKGIYLVNEQGEEVAATDILEKCGAARVFAFDGKMGAGKTTFIKCLCEAMGTEDVVNSPTFAIVNVYEISPQYLPNEFRGRPAGYSLEAKEEVYHFDCYRIKDLREAMDMGTEEYLYSGNYCFIEWAEMIEPLLPEDTVWVKIEVLENGERCLSFDA